VSLRDDPRFPTTNNTPSYRSYYLHTGLGGEEQWTYVVRALYPNGVADAAPVMATTPSWPAPTSVQTAIQWLPPTGSNSRGTQVVVVTWIGAAGVPGYLVYRVPLYGEPDVLATPTPVTGGSWTDQSPIYTKGYKVKSVGGLISAQADIAW
jgi:hypothetical protein